MVIKPKKKNIKTTTKGNITTKSDLIVGFRSRKMFGLPQIILLYYLKFSMKPLNTKSTVITAPMIFFLVTNTPMFKFWDFL